MVILIKPGVVIKQINDQFIEFCKALWECKEIDVFPVITSANDGSHMAGSLHYQNLAWDLRTKGLYSPTAMAMALKDRLSDDWDIVIEGDHIHCEFDIKHKEVA